MKRPSVAGFTLAEVIVVVAIIGLLSAVIIPSIQDARQNSKIKAETASVEQFRLNLTLYREVNRAFPEDSSWETAANALTPTYYTTAPLTDEWGNAYIYYNNYNSGTQTNYTMICSTGPDGTADTTGVPLTNSIPAAANDDLCVFLK